MSLQAWFPFEGNTENKGLKHIELSGNPTFWGEVGGQNLITSGWSGSDVYCSFGDSLASYTQSSVYFSDPITGIGGWNATEWKVTGATASWHYTRLVGYNSLPLTTLKNNTNKKYTLSFWMRSSVASKMQISIKEANATNALTNAVSFSVTGDSTWRFYAVTLTTVSTAPASVGKQILYLYGAEAAGTYAISRIKLEEGTVATAFNTPTSTEYCLKNAGGAFGGSCAAFRGTDALTASTPEFKFQFNQKFSISFWVNPNNNGGTVLQIGGGLIISISGTVGAAVREVHFEYATTAAQSSSRFNESIPVNTWTHVTYVVNNGVLTLYVNGEYKDSWAITSTIYYADSTFKIGGGDSSNSISLNDVKIWDHALSIKEVRENYYSPMLHYRFHEPLTDSSLSNTGFCKSKTNIVTDTTGMYSTSLWGIAASNANVTNVRKVQLENKGGYAIAFTSTITSAPSNVSGIYMRSSTGYYKTMKTNTVYTISFMGRCSVDGSNLYYPSIAENKSIISITGPMINNMFSLGTTWQRYTVTFNSGSDASVTNCFYLWSINDTKTREVFISDLRIVESSDVNDTDVPSQSDATATQSASRNGGNLIPTKIADTSAQYYVDTYSATVSQTHSYLYGYDAADDWFYVRQHACNEFCFTTDQTYASCQHQGITLAPGRYTFEIEVFSPVINGLAGAGFRIIDSNNSVLLSYANKTTSGMLGGRKTFNLYISGTASKTVGIVVMIPKHTKYRMSLTGNTKYGLQNKPGVSFGRGDCSGYGNDGNTLEADAYAYSDTVHNKEMFFTSQETVDALFGVRSFQNRITDKVKQFSICYWINYTSASDAQYIYSSQAFRTGIDTNKKFRFIFYTTDLTTGASTSHSLMSAAVSAITTGWHHICITSSTVGVFKIYVDGVFQTEVGSAISNEFYTRYTDTSAFIGCYIAYNYPCRSALNNFKIYNMALPQDVITSLYQTATSIDEFGNVYTTDLVESFNSNIKMTAKKTISAPNVEEIIDQDSLNYYGNQYAYTDDACTNLIGETWQSNYKPGNGTTNSCGCTYRIQPDGPGLYWVEYDIAFSGFNSITASNFAMQIQGASVVTGESAYTWTGGNYFTSGSTGAAIFGTKPGSLVTWAKASGKYHVKYAINLTQENLNTRSRFQWQVRTDYSNGTGNVTISHVRVYKQFVRNNISSVQDTNKCKFYNDNTIKATNIIEK